MTPAHLSEQLEAVILKHKHNNLKSIESKLELVLIAKDWMSHAEIDGGISEKFNEWNSAMAHLVEKHGITGIPT